MTPEEHKKRHEILHRHLDELFADYIGHHPDQRGFINMPLIQLIRWSHEQAENPTELKQMNNQIAAEYWLKLEACTSPQEEQDVIKSAIEKAIDVAFQQQAKTGQTPKSIEEIHHTIQSGMEAARQTDEYRIEGEELSRAAHGSDVEEQAWHDGTMSPEVRATIDRAAHGSSTIDEEFIHVCKALKSSGYKLRPETECQLERAIRAAHEREGCRDYHDVPFPEGTQPTQPTWDGKPHDHVCAICGLVRPTLTNNKQGGENK